jgi:hypothetical protein
MTALPSRNPSLPAGIRVQCDDCGVRGRAADFIAREGGRHRCWICAGVPQVENIWRGERIEDSTLVRFLNDLAAA